LEDLKLILIILATFASALITSLLFELDFFKHWLRYAILVLSIILELYIGFAIVVSFLKNNQSNNTNK